jgi:hypothetical protein
LRARRETDEVTTDELGLDLVRDSGTPFLILEEGLMEHVTVVYVT